ncbi:hypothetical protein HZU40_22475 [Mycolicibacterium fluoranthenivorans]|uniref:Uncharacterized protein n=1 Tax=Mycolicibacterium fluoranthenivorans TaxID=258505 RepID=A0A7G8P9G5_9MYCO|nr:hypothetical protein [Mycolicibacterium fluoranthenivorans]QNJ90981.1 hypothetical protein HZU40_22475 [Mycolicibacterium fluoranthenivorans]
MNWGDLAHYPFHADVWGDAATWVGALMTGVASLIAANVYRTNSKDKRREQSSLITFPSHYTSAMDEDFFLTSVRGRVHNHSSALITHAAIVIEMTNRAARKRLSRFDRWLRPHKKTIVYHHLRDEENRDITDTILPGEDRRYYVEMPDDAGLCAEEVVVKLTFMDANAVEWERPMQGAPVESKLPGKIRTKLITWLQWRDWEKANPEIEETSDPPEGEDPNAPTSK